MSGGETQCKCGKEGCALYESPIFLDCCGLVRQVLRDLKEEFGFETGPWNQAYQFDTLPIRYDEWHLMKPGDLVFAEGKYVKEGVKPQKGDIVHVEVCVCVCVCVCVYMCIYCVCVCVCVIHTHTHMYIYTCIYVYIGVPRWGHGGEERLRGPVEQGCGARV